MATADPPPRPQTPPSGATDPAERFGPLRLRRLAKEDGRALIVYEWAPGSDRPAT